jgi:hypothetical protein
MSHVEQSGSQRESRMGVAGGCRKGDKELVFNVHRASVGEDENVLEMVVVEAEQCEWT